MHPQRPDLEILLVIALNIAFVCVIAHYARAHYFPSSAPAHSRVGRHTGVVDQAIMTNLFRVIEIERPRTAP